jgi:hypothetical protein
MSPQQHRLSFSQVQAAITASGFWPASFEHHHLTAYTGLADGTESLRTRRLWFPTSAFDFFVDTRVVDGEPQIPRYKRHYVLVCLCTPLSNAGDQLSFARRQFNFRPPRLLWVFEHRGVSPSAGLRSVIIASSAFGRHTGMTRAQLTEPPARRFSRLRTGSRKSSSHPTPRWSKPDSNSWSHLRAAPAPNRTGRR